MKSNFYQFICGRKSNNEDKFKGFFHGISLILLFVVSIFFFFLGGQFGVFISNKKFSNFMFSAVIFLRSMITVNVLGLFRLLRNFLFFCYSFEPPLHCAFLLENLCTSFLFPLFLKIIGIYKIGISQKYF